MTTRLLPIALLAASLAACAMLDPGRGAASAPAGGSVVPVQIVQNIVLVPVVLNGRHGATLLLDTGAQYTIVNPEVAARAGLDAAAGTPRTVRVAGGRTLEMPFVPLAALSVGEATVENLQVGVYRTAPSARIVDGILGADFLSRFTITIDRSARHLRLERPRRARGGG
ncbi:MAG TPA: retropepsin-like aspartic protease [Candidatus Tectomicrobia bacterium]|nr:retropepsin-like aspartic protease [Candidatus Tectomicrobia bacterium]